jgi:hypothetical protein
VEHDFVIISSDGEVSEKYTRGPCGPLWPVAYYYPAANGPCGPSMGDVSCDPLPSEGPIGPNHS